MPDTLLKLYVKCKMLADVIKEEHGQDLVEYAAVITLVVLALASGMSTLANGINSAMTTVSGKINNML